MTLDQPFKVTKLRQIASIHKKAEESQLNGISRISCQIWSQVNRFGARGQNLVKHYFSKITFFYNSIRTICPTETNLTSSCFCRWDESSDTHSPPKKRQVQNLTSRPIHGVPGQIRSKLVILGINRFTLVHISLWYPFHSSIIFGSKVMGKRVTSPHRVIMGRVKNWPDVRSLEYEIRNMHSVCIHSDTSYWKFENIQTKTVPTARSSRLKPFPERTADFDLTWWPAFLTWQVKFAHKVYC